MEKLFIIVWLCVLVYLIVQGILFIGKSKKKDMSEFPHRRLLLAAFLCSATTSRYTSPRATDYFTTVFLIFVITLFISAIPMLIAYAKNSTNKQTIYWWATFTVLPICWPVAFIWSIVDKSVKEKEAK